MPDEFNLGLCELSNLFPGRVQVVLPSLEQDVEVVPVLLRERPVHRARHGNSLVVLVKLGAN